MRKPISIPTANTVEAWFFRHGESVGNVGGFTSDPSTIDLTPKGKLQAERISHAFEHEPNVIVVSPYLRAWLTALPTMKRYPRIPVQKWCIQEFTYLSPCSCENTTPTMRQPLVQAYWQRGDPLYIDGPGAESFAQFVQRVKSCKERCEMLVGRTVLFTHSQFIHGIMMALSSEGLSNDRDSMSRFRAFNLSLEIPNAAYVAVRFAGYSTAVSGVMGC